MPHGAPALSLDSGPHGVQDARRWVVGAIGRVGRPDLAECAEMGVSELVTNALLHGAAPITVRVGGTREHPRVEVRDASPEPPVLPVAAGTAGTAGTADPAGVTGPGGTGGAGGPRTAGTSDAATAASQPS